MKELRFQRNAFIILAVTTVIVAIALVVDTIMNGFYWPSAAALLFVAISTVERYGKYKSQKSKVAKSVEN